MLNHVLIIRHLYELFATKVFSVKVRVWIVKLSQIVRHSPTGSAVWFINWRSRDQYSMCSLFQVSSSRSWNNCGKISFQPWQDSYVFLKVTWEDSELSCELTLEITFFTSVPSESWEDWIALRRKTEKDRDIIFLSILSSSWWLPYYTLLPGFRCILNRILIRKKIRSRASPEENLVLNPERI